MCWFLTRPKTWFKIVWKEGALCLLFNRWFTSGILDKSTVWVEKSFHATIYVEEARVFRSKLTTFRPFHSLSGFRNCCDCRECCLLCDLPKALTDKTQVCGWVRGTRILCAKHQDASLVLSLGDFVLESLFYAQRFIVWLTYRLKFLNVSRCL